MTKKTLLQAQGERVKWLRRHYDETGEAFCERMGGFSQSSLSKIERGERAIPRSLLLAIVAESGLTSDFLLHGSTAGLSDDWLRYLTATQAGLALIVPQK